MKTCDYEQNLVSDGQLPRLLLPSCSDDIDAHDPVASFLCTDKFVHSFPTHLWLWFLLSLLCLYTWMSLVSFLARIMDLDGNPMTATKRSFDSKNRVGKSVKHAKKKTHDRHVPKVKKAQDQMKSPPPATPIMSPIVTLVVGSDQRLFVAHEDVLSCSPFFATILQEQMVEDNMNKAVVLPDEEPEILSCILEFLYKGDYFPRLLRNKNTDSWGLENAQDIYNTGGRGSSEATIFHAAVGDLVLRDTVVYCAAERYELEDLKKLALRKQGLQSGIPIDVILRSARYAYDHTPETEYRLRAHYLAMIIRTRQIFKSSGTMQLEMENGHKFFFDLFVAMCNHMDDLEDLRESELPKKV
ncbi:hypothetical protein BDV59DRAFT_198684 [Aspergillus ambiguus]|uniref:BTB/POZ domain-containing protein n=1 Tax=Aspergillus ambiguus TaxID=176160 RepID=UPI003CCD558D